MSYEKLNIETVASKAKAIFKICDYENKGFLTKKDIVRLKDELPLCEEQLEKAFDKLDDRGQGFLTYSDFIREFGSFLGLPSSNFTQIDSEEIFTNEDVYDNDMREEEKESPDFNLLLNELSQCGFNRDLDVVKSLWQRLRQKDRVLSENFEKLISRVRDALQTSHLDYRALRTSVENKNILHDEEMSILYDEMEHRLTEEKNKMIKEQKLREINEMRKLEEELKVKDNRVKELLFQLSEMESKMNKIKERNENEKTSRKNEEKRTEDNLNSSLIKLQKPMKQLNSKNQKLSYEISDWINLERDNLLLQIHQLKEKNKSLLDKKDELEKSSILLPDSKRETLKVQNDILYKNQADFANKELENVIKLKKFSVDYDLYDTEDEEQILNDNKKDDDYNFDCNICKETNIDETQFSLSPLPKSLNRLYKIVFVGDSTVGKTSFIYRVCKNKFNSNLASTVGIDLQITQIKVDDCIVTLQLWDTAGQERFRSYSKQYFRKADAVMVMFDLTSFSSFLHSREWILRVKENIEQDTILVLIGTKYDKIYKISENNEKEELSHVNSCEARKLAYEYNASYFETSSLTGYNNRSCLFYLASILKEKEDNLIKRSMTLTPPSHQIKSSAFKLQTLSIYQNQCCF